MERIVQKFKFHHLVYFLGGSILFIIVIFSFSSSSGNLFLAALKFSRSFFNNTDNFVLFADKEIELAQSVQVSSGDLGSNDKIDVQKDVIINGNLFAKEITIDKNTTINGNASYNKLKLHKDSRILGVTSSPVSLPVADLPEIPDFSVGTQDFKFAGQNNALPSGNYRNIVLEKDSRLALTGGTYNLNKLELKENSTLIYNSPTTVNIQSELKTRQHIAILPGNNDLEPLDLTVNYQGKATIDDDDEDEDEDNNDNNNDDDGNDDENKKIKSRFQNFRERFSKFFKKLLGFLKKTENRKDNGVKPVQFGNDSFLNFKLLAPKANVKLGGRTTFRGQILSRGIKVGKDSILSREDDFEKESDLSKIVEVQGAKIIANEIIVIFKDGADIQTFMEIAELIGVRPTGFLDKLLMGKLEVNATTFVELNNFINQIKNLNHPLIEKVLPNALIF